MSLVPVIRGMVETDPNLAGDQKAITNFLATLLDFSVIPEIGPQVSAWSLCVHYDDLRHPLTAHEDSLFGPQLHLPGALAAPFAFTLARRQQERSSDPAWAERSLTNFWRRRKQQVKANASCFARGHAQ